MAEDLLNATQTTDGQDSAALKKKVADQAADASVQTTEDPTRASLHYGEDHQLETAANDAPEAQSGAFDAQFAASSDPVEAQQNPQSESQSGTPSSSSQGSGAAQTGAMASPDAVAEMANEAEVAVASTAPGETSGPEASNADETPVDPQDRPSFADANSPPPPSEPTDAAQGAAEEDAAENAPPQQQSAAETTASPEQAQTSAEPQPNAGSQAESDQPEATNSAPSQISISASDIAENDEGAIVGQLDVTDLDPADTHSFTISDERFEVVDGAVKLKDGVALDHEQASSIALEITATDSQGNSITQSFEINVADQNEGPGAISLSNAAVAENAEGAIVGQINVSDVDLNDTHSFSLSDDRFEVVDGAVKLKDGASLDQDEGAVSLQVTATDSGGASVTQSFDISVAQMPDAALSTGFRAQYFDMDSSLSRIDQIDWTGAPTHEELVDDINYHNSTNSFWEGGSKDTFGAKITGNIEVTEAGSFNFHIGGDDGVVLFINGVEVIENDGLHSFRTRSGEIDLEPGTHVIEVRYFENYGHAGLKVEWEGPGIDGKELLTAPDTEDMQTVGGMPVMMTIDVGPTNHSDDAVQHMIEGLPEGTLIQAGDQVAEANEDGVVDVTGWDISMLSMTPPVAFVGEVEATFTTQVTLGDGQVVTSEMDMTVTVNEAQIPPHSVEVSSGFHASYYDVDHSLKKLDDIDWNDEPTHEEVVSEINYENGRGSFWEGGDTDTFGAKITGQITVEEGGSYDFFIGGDDGVILLINGVEVIDNDGLHGYRTRSGEIELEPGTHEIEVRYFENYGHAGLKLEWDGPDTDGREMVQADPDMSIAENGIMDIAISADASDTVTLTGLPADTIIVSGEDTTVADGGDVDISGWNLDMIEIMPPNDYAGEINAEVTVEGQTFNGQATEVTVPFTIKVGDEENWNQSQSSDDDMILASQDNANGNSDGWAAEEGGHGDDAGAADDDPMQEQVEMNQNAEQSSENYDTYERQDW